MERDGSWSRLQLPHQTVCSLGGGARWIPCVLSDLWEEVSHLVNPRNQLHHQGAASTPTMAPIIRHHSCYSQGQGLYLPAFPPSFLPSSSPALSPSLSLSLVCVYAHMCTHTPLHLIRIACTNANRELFTWGRTITRQYTTADYDDLHAQGAINLPVTPQGKVGASWALLLSVTYLLMDPDLCRQTPAAGKSGCNSRIISGKQLFATFRTIFQHLHSFWPFFSNVPSALECRGWQQRSSL